MKQHVAATTLPCVACDRTATTYIQAPQYLHKIYIWNVTDWEEWVWHSLVGPVMEFSRIRAITLPYKVANGAGLNDWAARMLVCNSRFEFYSLFCSDFLRINAMSHHNNGCINLIIFFFVLPISCDVDNPLLCTLLNSHRYHLLYYYYHNLQQHTHYIIYALSISSTNPLWKL